MTVEKVTPGEAVFGPCACDMHRGDEAGKPCISCAITKYVIEAVAAERERCAKVVEFSRIGAWKHEVAAAIRRGGEEGK